MRTWTQQEMWQRLSPYQRAAAMAIMEADGRDPVAARNVLGAIINRSERTRDPLGEHVSKPIYQPTIEMSQFARLPSILQSPQFAEMTALAEKRAKGEVGDWVQGATHFLAPEKTMLSLHRQNPDKYHNWGPLPNSRGIPGKNWTGFDPATGEYKGVILRDASHAFLAPDGRHEGAAGGPAPDFAKPTHVAGMGDDPSAFKAAKPSPLGSGTASADTSLQFAAQYLANQEAEDAKGKNELARMGAEAQAAIPTAPKGSPMIQGPRLPRVDLQSLLAVLRERGVDLTGKPGGLGAGGGSLGTRRA